MARGSTRSGQTAEQSPHRLHSKAAARSFLSGFSAGAATCAGVP